MFENGIESSNRNKGVIINNGTTYSSRKSTCTLPRVILGYSNPEIPYVKCSFDASFDEISSQSRGWWILRDQDGMKNAWGSSDLNGATSPLIAETKALLVVMQQTWIQGFK